MAIAVDSSTPALVGGSVTTLQTATFSPPAGSVLVACVHADPGRAFTIANTVASLSWGTVLHTAPDNSVTAFSAVLAGGATNMSVSVTGPLNNAAGFKVWVVTGADTAAPIGAVAFGATLDAANILTKTLVPQVSNSLGFIVGEDGLASGTTTSPNTTAAFYDVAQSIAGGSGYRLTGAAGGTETFSFDAAGTAASAWAWGVFEVRAAPATAPNANALMTHGTARHRASTW